MQLLFKEAERLDVKIFFADLGGDILGYYSKKAHITIIQQGMVLPQIRYVGMHELGHAYFGHDCSTPRNERQADLWAARKLINLPDYIRSERINDGNIFRIAEDLGVTAKLITIYQSMLQTSAIRVIA